MEDGEHIALMGPSGSGKTSILRLIAGQLKATSGTVNVTHQRISHMFQEHRLLPWLTAEENVNLVLSDRPDTMEDARSWLRAVGLSNAMGKYPSELSGGMRQRVALARALAYNGDLFLFDEPLSSLEESLAEELLDLVTQYTKDKSMIFVTHQLEQAKKINGNCYMIKNKTLESI